MAIYEFVKHARDEYYSRTIEVVSGYEFSQYETLRTVELYHKIAGSPRETRIA